MIQKSAYPHLNYIIDTIEVIEKHTPPNLQAFLEDRNAQDATLMRLQDIGEQLARLRTNFPEFYEKHHSTTWNKIIGLRNIISHGYREIEFDIIWDVVSKKLTEFKTEIEHVLGTQ